MAGGSENRWRICQFNFQLRSNRLIFNMADSQNTTKYPEYQFKVLVHIPDNCANYPATCGYVVSSSCDLGEELRRFRAIQLEPKAVVNIERFIGIQSNGVGSSGVQMSVQMGHESD